MVNMANGWIAVERHDKVAADKTRNLGENPFLQAMSVSNNFGKVVFSHNREQRVATLIYFGNSYEKIIMDGRELLIMKADNVFATVTEG